MFHPCSRCLRYSFGLLLLLTCQQAAAESAVEPSLHEQFVSDAAKAWAEAEKMNRDLEFEVDSISNNRTEDGKSWVDRRKVIVKSRGDMVLQETTDWPPEGNNLPGSLRESTSTQSRVDAINDKHSFILREEGDFPWNVNSVGSVKDEQVIQAIDRRSRRLIFLPWYISNWSLLSMYRSAYFHIEKVEPVQEGDLALVKVSFTYSPLAPEDKSNFIRSGSVVLNPNRKWSVHSCEANLQYPNGQHARITVSNQYKEASDVVPIKSTFSLVALNGARGVEETDEFTNYARKLVPENEFTMGAYGVTMSLEPRANRTPWIMLNIGFILLIIGLILYRRFRNRIYTKS
jgi:hypothetical protein